MLMYCIQEGCAAVSCKHVNQIYSTYLYLYIQVKTVCSMENSFGNCLFFPFPFYPPLPQKCGLVYLDLRTEFFWAIMQGVVVIPYQCFGTNKLSRNVGNKLPLFTA